MKKDKINYEDVNEITSIGKKILNILQDKIKTGVEVRFLYDAVGSRTLDKEYLKKLVSLGGKVGEFFPSWLKIINPNMNFRNHRKNYI